MLARNNVITPTGAEEFPSDVLTAEEVAIIQARTALKIYEPVVVDGQIVFSATGDVLIAFGGNYAA